MAVVTKVAPPPAPVHSVYPKWVHAPLTGPKRIVHNHLEEQEATGIPMQENGYPVGVEPPLPPSMVAAQAASAANLARGTAYPMWVTVDGHKELAEDHIRHSLLTGVLHGPDGKPVAEAPAPPVVNKSAAVSTVDKAKDPLGDF